METGDDVELTRVRDDLLNLIEPRDQSGASVDALKMGRGGEESAVGPTCQT